MSTFTLITWKCFFSPHTTWSSFPTASPALPIPQAAAAIYHFAGALLLLGLLPALIVKLVFREKLADYGVRLGDRRRTVRSFLLCAPVVVLAAYMSARSRPRLDGIPDQSPRGCSPQTFTLHALQLPAVLSGLGVPVPRFHAARTARIDGNANAMLVQVMASVMLHLGKPVSEVYASIVGGLVWGILAYRTRSLLSGLLQHFLLGVLLDWFICHR